jgi:hypothetical protein
MQSTAWRNLDGERRIRATFGISPYNHFSLTGETTYRERMDSCGCLHEDIRKAFPELAPFIRWHLTDNTGTPMHYAANGVYWLVANHAIAAKETPAKALDYFKSTVVFGAVEGDEVPELRKVDAWLAARLPKLQKAFHDDMGRVLCLNLRGKDVPCES